MEKVEGEGEKKRGKKDAKKVEHAKNIYMVGRRRRRKWEKTQKNENE